MKHNQDELERAKDLVDEMLEDVEDGLDWVEVPVTDLHDVQKILERAIK